MSLIAGVIALGVCVSACGGESPSVSPSPTPTVAASTTRGAADRTYKFDVFDLCTRTDVQSVADLGLKVRSTDRTPPVAMTGEACLFEFNTPSGSPASLRVEAVTAADVDEAQRVYRTQSGGRMKPEGSISGIGEQAEAFALETEPQQAFKYSEYRVHARDGNLVIEVWLAIGGKAFTPKETLATKTTAITQRAFAMVTEAWKTR